MGNVYAYKAELDAWWSNRRPALEVQEKAREASRRGLQWAAVGLGVALAVLAVAARWWLTPAPAPSRGPEPIAGLRFVMGALQVRGIGERSLHLSPDGSRIAYNKRDRRGVWISDLSGFNERKIDAGPGAHLWPAWSPDGAQLVYASLRGGDRTGLWVTSLNGGAEYQLTQGEAGAPAWSPDGKSIAFVVGGDLRLVPSTGGTPRSLTRLGVAAYGLHWSADSKKIAAGGLWGTGGNVDVYYYDVERETRVRITTDAAFDLPAGWSSDGRYAYFISNRGASFQLWKVAISERTGQPIGDPVQVTHSQQLEVARAVQSPDCRTMALQLKKNSVRVALMDIENGKTKKVLVEGSQPQWLDGQTLLYLAGPWLDAPTGVPGYGDLVAQNIATGGGKKVTERGDVVLFRVSPDRTSVAFLAVDTSQVQQGGKQRPLGTMSQGGLQVPEAKKTLYVIPAAGGPEFELLEIKEGGLFTWSPDSSRLAVFSGGALLVVPVTGGQPQVLISDQVLEELVWSPDGNSIFYTAYNPGPESDIYRVPAAGGPAKNVTRDSKFYHASMACSPDGKKLVYTKADSAEEDANQLWSLDLETGQSQPLKTPGWNPVWSPDGSRLAFWSWRKRPLDIFTLDVRTGGFQRLTEDDDEESNLQWSPDGKSLAFTLKREERQLWLLDNP